LDAFVDEKATRQQVVAVLGEGDWYEPGGANWSGLGEYLAREPEAWGAPLRSAYAQGQRIMYYTSMWQMTWLFFDKQNTLRGYWITAQ
jgi:hypothetical protein